MEYFAIKIENYKLMLDAEFIQFLNFPIDCFGVIQMYFGLIFLLSLVILNYFLKLKGVIYWSPQCCIFLSTASSFKLK